MDTVPGNWRQGPCPRREHIWAALQKVQPKNAAACCNAINRKINKSTQYRRRWCDTQNLTKHQHIDLPRQTSSLRRGQGRGFFANKLNTNLGAFMQRGPWPGLVILGMVLRQPALRKRTNTIFLTKHGHQFSRSSFQPLENPYVFVANKAYLSHLEPRVRRVLCTVIIQALGISPLGSSFYAQGISRLGYIENWDS